MWKKNSENTRAEKRPAGSISMLQVPHVPPLQRKKNTASDKTLPRFTLESHAAPKNSQTPSLPSKVATIQPTEEFPLEMAPQKLRGLHFPEPESTPKHLKRSTVSRDAITCLFQKNNKTLPKTNSKTTLEKCFGETRSFTFRGPFGRF